MIGGRRAANRDTQRRFLCCFAFVVGLGVRLCPRFTKTIAETNSITDLRITLVGNVTAGLFPPGAGDEEFETGRSHLLTISAYRSFEQGSNDDW